MTVVLVPVRCPLSAHSKRTLAQASAVARDRDGTLTVLHVDLYHETGSISGRDLKRAVEAEVDILDDVRYLVRAGFTVEETVLDEVAASGVDIVVIGEKQIERWRSMIRRLVEDPDVETYLRNHLDARIITPD